MPLPDSSSTPFDAAPLVLREARRLHRAAFRPTFHRPARAASPDRGRRAGWHQPAAALHRARHTVQRKHLLRLLAAEAGHTSWEAWRPALRHALPQDLLHLRLHGSGTANTWFATEDEARRAMHGREGRLVRVGWHAVWLAPLAAGPAGRRPGLTDEALRPSKDGAVAVVRLPGRGRWHHGRTIHPIGHRMTSRPHQLDQWLAQEKAVRERIDQGPGPGIRAWTRWRAWAVWS